MTDVTKMKANKWHNWCTSTNW